MRLLSLAVFAVLALVIGVYERDGMTIGLGVAAGLAAVASLPSLRISTFLELMAELFTVETVTFGLGDLASILGLWPEAYKE
jgi:putative ATP-binding cassette transporter